MKRINIVAAVMLAGLAAVWSVWLGPIWTNRVPRDAVFSSNYVGTDTNVDPKSGVVPTRDVFSTYERVLRVVDARDWPRSVLLRDDYTTHIRETGAIGFEYSVEERIDPKSGAWADGPHKGDIVLFPRNTERRSYILRSNFIQGIPLRFSRVEEIGGLEVYLFSYLGPLELTASYAGTRRSPAARVLPGQEIRCSDDQFYYRVWVEPRTGRELKVEEGCMSGDFVYNKATGAKVAAVDRWNGLTTGRSLSDRINEVYVARHNYMWASLYLPGLLLLAAAIVVADGYSRRDGAIVA